jgi:hypothetical protein
LREVIRRTRARVAALSACEWPMSALPPAVESPRLVVWMTYIIHINSKALFDLSFLDSVDDEKHPVIWRID